MAIVVVATGVAAVRLGWWWAGIGQSHPVAATPAGATLAAAAPAGAPGAVVSGADQADPTRADQADRTRTDQAAGVPSAAAAHWRSVVERLDGARTAALRSRDVDMLAAVYTSDAPGRAADSRRITHLVTAGFRVSDARHEVHDVTVLSTDLQRGATVRVVESLPSYPVLDEDGAVVGHTTGSDARAVVMDIRRTPDGPRISRIVPG